MMDKERVMLLSTITLLFICLCLLVLDLYLQYTNQVTYLSLVTASLILLLMIYRQNKRMKQATKRKRK